MNFGWEAGGAGFAAGKGVADTAEADGAAKASVLAVPESFAAGALELFESGGGEGKIAAAEAGGVGVEAFGELVDPGVADTEQAGDAGGRPFGRSGEPPLPDKLFDDAGFEAAAPRERRTTPCGARFLDIDEARPASAGRFVAGSFAAHGEIC